VCARSWHGRPVDGFVVRKEIKDHGTEQKIDGNFKPDSNVILFDDVSTKGGSVKRALFGRRWRELPDGCVKSLRGADKPGKQRLIDIHSTLVFGQVAFVVSFEERLYVGVSRTQRMSESLEDGDAVLGSISLVTKRGERQPVSGAVR
jgi:hypothetical protein